MDKYILSEVCYRNGFADGQSAPIYYVTGPLELVKTMSHELEAVKNEIESLTVCNGWLLTIYEFIPDSWNEPQLITEYVWEANENKYVERNLNLKN